MAVILKSYTTSSFPPQNVPVCRSLMHATGFSSTQDFGREILCKVGLIYTEWVCILFSMGLGGFF